MSELIALTSKSVSAGSTYLDWNDNYVKSTGTIFQNHADGTRFNGQVSYSVQKINQATEVNSKYYRRFDQMQATIDQGSVSKDGSAGNKIYFIENKANNSAAVSYFKYGLDNKLNESQCFNYQSNILTSRTQIMHNSIGQITKSQKFNIHDELVESNVFSYKKDRIGNDLIIIQKEKYSGNEVVSTTHKELYDSSGKIIKIDVYDKNDKQLERNEFSYFNNGNKCRTVKSTFNISGNLNHQEKITRSNRSDSGQLKREIESHLDINGQESKRISQYYSNSGIRCFERSFSAGKMTGKVYMGFDNNGNAINIKRLNPEGEMVDVSINASLDTFFKGVTQLADAINSFPTREQAPAPVDTIIGSHANQRLRNLVPVMNYASRQ